MKVSLIVSIVAAFVLGGVAGYVIYPTLSASPAVVVQKNEAQKLMSKYKEVDFFACQAAPDDAKYACAEQALFADAQMRKDQALCERVVTEPIRQACRQVIERQQTLGSAAETFCQGLPSDTLCLDLAQTLNAVDSQTPQSCEGIVVDPVRALCQQLTSAEIKGGKTLRFGYSCLGDKATCAGEREIFVQAVKNNRVASCASLAGSNKDACVYEVQLYQAFIAKDPRVCEKVSPPSGEEKQNAIARCKTELSLVLVLEGGDARACGTDVAPDLLDLCRQLMLTAAEKRFDYLNAQ